MSSSLNDVLTDIAAERFAQDAKWGQQNHPDGTGQTGSTFAANMARSICNAEHKAGRGTWNHIATEEFCEALAETDPAKLRKELVQTAAVLVAWIEAIDRAPYSRG